MDLEYVKLIKYVIKKSKNESEMTDMSVMGTHKMSNKDRNNSLLHKKSKNSKRNFKKTVRKNRNDGKKSRPTDRQAKSSI